MTDGEAAEPAVVSVGGFTQLVAAVVEVVLLGATAGIGWFVWWLVACESSTSPAKQVLHLQVVHRDDGRPADLTAMARRELLGPGLCLTFALAGLGLWRVADEVNGRWLVVAGVAWGALHLALAIATPSHRGLWDRMADTVVVERPVVDDPALVSPPEVAGTALA